MLTKSQIAWASMHDWFVRDNRDGTITVREVVTYQGETTQEERLHSGSFASLRTWAGY